MELPSFLLPICTILRQKDESLKKPFTEVVCQFSLGLVKRNVLENQTIAFLVQKMSKPAELTLPTPSDALTISAFSNCCVATLAEKKYLSGIPNFDAKLTVKF